MTCKNRWCSFCWKHQYLLRSYSILLVDEIVMEDAIFTHCRFHLFADTNAQALPAQIEHCEREDG